MQLEAALKALAATKHDDNETLPAFFEGDDDAEFVDEEDGEVVEVTEEELLRFLDEQLPPLAVRCASSLRRRGLHNPCCRSAVNSLTTTPKRSRPSPHSTCSSSSSMGTGITPTKPMHTHTRSVTIIDDLLPHTVALALHAAAKALYEQGT